RQGLMPSIDSVEEVTVQIYDAAADPALWPDCLERLRGELNAAGTALIDYDFASRACRVFASAGTAVDFVECYQEGLASRIPWIRDGPWYALGRVSQGHEIIADDELAKSPVYLRWLKPNGFFHRLCGVLCRSEDRVLFVVASRPASSGRYDEGEARFLGDLLPHLRRAVRLSRKLLCSGTMASAFQHLPHAVFIVDRAGRPVLKNGAAEALLNRSGLRLDGEGRLSAGTATATVQLHRALAGLANGEAEASCHVLITAGAASRAAQLLTVAPIGTRATAALQGHAAVLVVAAPDGTAEWRPRSLRETYGLTPAEERLALLILQGLRLDEAEAVLGIRHSTARTHMRGIYAKTGTRRQVELVRLLMSAQSRLWPLDLGEEERR
ncbi:MAG TPA: helix-turn-helix transcriptional regulator, partial [Afifellaceae bacterium]|nr:helix-turn-helix transcriptional regulator [Afifellaceae bacterium]